MARVLVLARAHDLMTRGIDLFVATIPKVEVRIAWQLDLVDLQLRQRDRLLELPFVRAVERAHRLKASIGADSRFGVLIL